MLDAPLRRAAFVGATAKAERHWPFSSGANGSAASATIEPGRRAARSERRRKRPTLRIPARTTNKQQLAIHAYGSSEIGASQEERSKVRIRSEVNNYLSVIVDTLVDTPSCQLERVASGIRPNVGSDSFQGLSISA